MSVNGSVCSLSSQRSRRLSLVVLSKIVVLVLIVNQFFSLSRHWAGSDGDPLEHHSIVFPVSDKVKNNLVDSSVPNNESGSFHTRSSAFRASDSGQQTADGVDNSSSSIEPQTLLSQINIHNGTTSNHRGQNFTCPLRNTTWTFPTFPHFIIVGAQKAGTTAIGKLLREVPHLVGSRKPEPHFWDNTVPHRLVWTPAQKCLYRFKYLQKFPQDKIGPKSIVFEKTPVLLARPEKAAVIRAMLDPYPPKAVIILRDPVARYYSAYKMDWQNSGAKRPTYPSVDETITKEVQKLRRWRLLVAPPLNNATEWNQADFAVGTNVNGKHEDYSSLGLARGFYSPQVKEYMKHFPLGTSLKIICYENFLKNKHGGMRDLLEFVGAPPYSFTDQQMDEQLGPLKVVKQWYPPMDNRTRVYLKQLYKPFNDELADLLGEEWRGVWDD